MKRLKRFAVSTLLILLIFSSCRGNERITKSEFALDTVVTLNLYSRKDEWIVEPFFRYLRELEGILDRYDEKSELRMVNENAYSEEVVLSDVLYDVISKGFEIARETDGAFDIAIGPLVDLWQIGTRTSLPEGGDVERALSLSSWEYLDLDEEKHSIRFQKDGMSLDLGGIGKGYIASLLMEYLKENGVERASLNLGGNISLLGDGEHGKYWRIGIRRPEDDRSDYVDVIEVSYGGNVSTSGGYERYSIFDDGKRYSHIISPKTGYPVKGDLASVTVVSTDASLADALSTASYVVGSEGLEELSEKFSVRIIALKGDQSIETYDATNASP